MQRSDTVFVKNGLNTIVLRTPRSINVRISQPEVADDVMFPYLISFGDQQVSNHVQNHQFIEETFPKDVSEGQVTLWFYGLDNPPTVWEFFLLPEAHGNDPRDLQAKLNAVSHDCGLVDNDIGPVTETAIDSFQCQNDLPSDVQDTSATEQALQSQQQFGS